MFVAIFVTLTSKKTKQQWQKQTVYVPQCITKLIKFARLKLFLFWKKMSVVCRHTEGNSCRYNLNIPDLFINIECIFLYTDIFGERHWSKGNTLSRQPIPILRLQIILVSEAVQQHHQRPEDRLHLPTVPLPEAPNGSHSTAHIPERVYLWTWTSHKH